MTWKRLWWQLLLKTVIKLTTSGNKSSA